MKNKDYNSVYEKQYNKYLNKFIKEIERLYRQSKKEGDAENFAYNYCVSTLSKKSEGLKIVNYPFQRIYSKFKERGSLVQENNLNRLFDKHIIPLCRELNIKAKTGFFDDILDEFAIIEASKQIISWFSSWSPVYKMMFILNDFSKFKIIRNSKFYENSETFIFYYKKLYPSSYLKEMKEGENSNFQKNNAINFQVLEKKKINIEHLYKQSDYSFIDKDLTSLEDFKNVLFKSSIEHSSKIYFEKYFETQQIAFLLKQLEKYFANLNQTTIGKSSLFYIINNKSEQQILTRENLASSYKSMNEKSKAFSPSNKKKIKYIEDMLTEVQLN